MKPTKEERREVAEKLRDNAEKHPGMKLILSVGFACDALRPRGAMEWDVTSHDAAVYLADLIEPEAERTCRNVATPQDIATGRPFACDVCGAAVSDWEGYRCGFSDESHGWRYCPNCGAKVVAE